MAINPRTYIANDAKIPASMSGDGGKVLAVNSGATAYEHIAISSLGAIPEGSIVPWVGGYFTDGSNGTYTRVLGSTNDVAGANGYLNSLGWYVCDGSTLNDSNSTIFDGAGRYLPNLTDDRFIMGDTAAGGIGGASAMAHTHTLSHTHTTSGHALSTAEMPSHTHATGGGTGSSTLASSAEPRKLTLYYGTATGSQGSGNSHTHGNTGSASGSITSAASNTENRPLFLSCFYIIRAL